MLGLVLLPMFGVLVQRSKLSQQTAANTKLLAK
jgi:hypothetical protein